MRKLKFENNYYYHIYNRGVDKREIFQDDKDRNRFMGEIVHFNNTNQIFNLGQNMNRGSASIQAVESEKIVSIMCFCMMSNHFHLILKQNIDDGIARFMHKLGTGYTMYFNKKYDRSGSLFEGKFKAKFIESDEYMVHLSKYIHLNPVKMIQADFYDEGIKNIKEAEKYLENYKWSSYLDYIGKREISNLIDKKVILGYFNNKADKYKEYIIEAEPRFGVL